jgi:transposase
VGTPGPKVIGIDELSVRKGHTYRIIVSDLVRERPIRFGGNDRSEVSMELLFKELGEKGAGVFGWWPCLTRSSPNEDS